jgi:hypothetical protein
MTSESGYPDVMLDIFGPVIDTYRCRATLDGRRCQLFAAHGDPHAHAWLEPVTGRHHRSGAYPWHPHVVRWTDDGARWDATTSERLRWCCMFRP